VILWNQAPSAIAQDLSTCAAIHEIRWVQYIPLPSRDQILERLSHSSSCMLGVRRGTVRGVKNKGGGKTLVNGTRSVP
jgi:hypothetical protein